jgi:hypothetical protein
MSSSKNLQRTPPTTGIARLNNRLSRGSLLPPSQLYDNVRATRGDPHITVDISNYTKSPMLMPRDDVDFNFRKLEMNKAIL